MDRTSGKEVGGPYATKQDAERAMGSFDEPSGTLEIEEADEEEDGDDSSSKEASLRRTSESSQFPSGGTPATEGDPGPSDPGIEPHDQAQPQEEVGEPGGVAPKSTKPSQLPSEGGGEMGADLPSDVSSPQFDPASFSTDPIGNGINAVASLVIEENPGIDSQEARKIARKVVGMLVEAEGWGWHPHVPHIEDPLMGRHPLHFLMHERERRLKERRKQKQEGENRPDEGALPMGHQRYDPSEDEGHMEAPSSPAHGGLSEEEIPDLNEFDRKPPHKYWWMRESKCSLPVVAAWGWDPKMSEDIEDPLVDKSPSDGKSKGAQQDQQDKGDGGGSSLPHIPGAGSLLSGGEAGGAAAGAGEAGGAAALAEEALPLLLV